MLISAENLESTQPYGIDKYPDILGYHLYVRQKSADYKKCSKNKGYFFLLFTTLSSSHLLGSECQESKLIINHLNLDS